MFQHQQDITFTILHDGNRTEVHTFEGEYRNLMTLINDKIYVEDFGECKGIGRCGTCLVETSGIKGAVIMDRNEKSTLAKCAFQKENLRLSCQIMINSALNGSVITIVEEREDVR